ncbi:MAG TPA: NAD(P)-dependent oxidoreductase [Stellaceae bacterium]|nr:NAD(P)-dependent oxidoreductase [Stellaceae bacterium]
MNIFTMIGLILRHLLRLACVRADNLLGRKKKKVAFIGLGKMGAGMAGRILRMGYDLSVWNRTAAKADPLVATGAKLASSAEAAAGDADIVITSLMDDASVLELVNGVLLKAMKPGAIHLCVTTISPKCGDELQHLHSQAGTRYVSGPVAGRPDAAAAGRLVTYLAGAPDAIKIVKPVCESYAIVAIEVSDRSSVANSMKLAVNYVAASVIEIIGETYAFAEKSGIDLSHVQQFFQMAFAHPALKLYAQKARKRDYVSGVGFTMSGGLKDVRLMLSAAEEAGMNFEIGKIIERKMLAALSSDLANADWSATCEVTRREAGLSSSGLS